MVTNNSSDYQPAQYNIQTGGANGTLNNVSPSATSGVPVISQGSSSQPIFGTSVVAGGGTGNTTFTAYSVICAGTTATGAFQNVSGVGTSGQVLTSNGASALPTWQAGGSGGITTIDGDTGSVTGSTVNIVATATAGSSIVFSGSSATLSLKVTDSNTNTILGLSAGNSSISGSNNVGFGSSVLNGLTNGIQNTGAGVKCLNTLSSGIRNTAIGYSCGSAITTGGGNALLGADILSSSNVSNCAVVGSTALQFASGGNNCALGFGCFTNLGSGTTNIGLGYQAGTSYSGAESSNIIIGNSGVALESHVIRIGTQGSGTGQQSTCYIAGIEGVSVSNLNIVTINTSTGQLGSEATVGVANGGTGSASFNTNGVVISGATSTTALASLSLTDGQIVIGSSAGAPLAATITAGANITVTNGHNTITIAADTASQTVAYTAVNHAASPYTVLSTDYYLAVTTSAGVVTLNLPNAPSTGRIFVVKDTSGTSGTSNISITTPGGTVTFDGSTTYTLSTNYQSVSLIFNGTNYEVF